MEEAGQLNLFDSRREGQVIRTYSNLFARALQLDEQGSPDAITAYEEAIEKNVRPADALCNIATIFMDKGLTAEALDRLSRALVLDPRHALAHYNIGNVYLDTGKIEFTDRVRCGVIVSENEDGNETFHNDLIDQSEYPTIKELIDDIVGIFHVSKQNVMVTM